VRIVQLIPALSVGGAERIVSLLALAQHRAGHAVTVVALGPRTGSWIEQELDDNGVETVFLDKSPGFDARALPRLGRFLRRTRPDVLHTHLHVLKYLLPTRLAYRPPVVVHTLHNLAPQEAERADQLLQQLAFRWRVAPVAIGAAVARSTEELYGLDPAAVIPNGVPVDAFQSPAGTRERIRGELGLDAAAPVLLSVGRLNPQKNHALLLSAFAQAELAALGAQLLLAGKGELRDELQAQAAALGIAENVHFLGVRKDVPALLGAADLFVLASRYEGNPLVVMEAMAAGRAVVATAVGCVPELVGPETGRLVPPGDAAALGVALGELVQDIELAHSLGAAALRTARERFDVSVMADQYLALYARRAA
jgi:glycosyltransferase involved in cell wall biosynthesis